MKMSPPWGVAMVQPSIPVIEGDFAVQSVIELDLGAGEAQAAVLGRDLEAAAVPLHDVVIADDALIAESADALQVFGSRAPSCGAVCWDAGEAAIVIGDEAAQDLIGRVQIAGAREAK